MILISASTSCKRPGLRSQSGFTLLELMLVVSIIATLSWLTVIAIPDGRQKQIEDAAQTFRLQLKSHRQTATMKGQMLGVDLLDGAYQFLVWDHRQKTWQSFEQLSNLGTKGSSGKFDLATSLEMNVEHDLGFGEQVYADRLKDPEALYDEEKPQWQADILIFPDGRISRFSVTFGAEQSEVLFRVHGDAYEKAEVQNVL